MIPQFPEFKKIELTDRADVEAYTNLFEPYSDFNFTCLWAWNTEGKRMISELNGNLVVRFTDYVTGEPFLSFLGMHKQEETARTLIDYCKTNNLPTTLRFMPDVSISGIDPTVFMIEESRGDFDYVCSVPELATLCGNKYMNRRGKSHKFWKENKGATVEVIDLTNEEMQREIMELFSSWGQNKIALKEDSAIQHEFEAVKRLFASDILPTLLVAGLFSEGRMLGFTIGEKLVHGYVMDHFSKSVISYKGATEALMQVYAKYLDSLHVSYINFESDLDVDSMRQSKMSWRPVKFLKRYNIHYAQT